ncbi:hypothetical protein DUI87_05927 [Hirundo rustica rustica]|uniref:Uncharacterized protein n=1 Tax=Hirundo rustica rustica TaxID=333673 RepID=A0A3M0KX05_HIRRU|nr:hypothetical protein DUI87_05927 [Hirundo rustica rustica]
MDEVNAETPEHERALKSKVLLLESSETLENKCPGAKRYTWIRKGARAYLQQQNLIETSTASIPVDTLGSLIPEKCSLAILIINISSADIFGCLILLSREAETNRDHSVAVLTRASQRSSPTRCGDGTRHINPSYHAIAEIGQVPLGEFMMATPHDILFFYMLDDDLQKDLFHHLFKSEG